MRNNIKNILIISLPLFILACGFKPINQIKNKVIHIQNIDIIGDQRIAYLLKNNLLLISNINSENKYNSKINILKKKNNKIKNKKGKVTRYNLAISVNLRLININNNKEIQKSFSRNEDFEVAKIHSDTIGNEKSTTENLARQLSEDISNFINLSMRIM